jgi:trehalose 6-phosphate synthase/phosphatase
MERRLFIISNRLPVNIETHENEISVNISGGGLVTAISGYLDQKEQHREKEFDKKIWIGVPGCTANVWTKVQRDIPAEGYEYVPVFINKKSFEAYYNGMSNSVLWALFHYFPSFADFNSNYYEQYQKVNHDFLDVLMRYLQPNDTVWIHDYHLLPLAGLIRKHMPEITIGFFLHIPFPSFEIFRIMPKRWQRQLLEGMLGADLLGFHTMEYTTHFLKSVQMILGLEHDKFVLRYNDRIIRVGVFPISIDFEKFNDAYDLPQATRQRNQMRRQFAGKKIIFSADRLDYTKGVQNRLKDMNTF